MTTIGAILAITNPIQRQDIYLECISSMLPWADEIIIVDGGDRSDWYVKLREEIGSEGLEKIKVVQLPWPHEFSWDELPKHLNYGLAQIKSDWCIRVDADYVFKDCWKANLWELGVNQSKRIITAQKFSTILATKIYQKGPSPIIINMRYGDMCFGVAQDKYTDLCVPIIKTGMRGDIPEGKLVDDKDIHRSHLEFMNYDYCFKTKDFTSKEFLRFSRAHKRYFGSSKWGNTEEKSLNKFIEMMEYRMMHEKIHIYNMPWQLHPSFMKERVRDIKPEHFGYNGWGIFN